MNEKLRIDTLRGIACVLLVFFHVVGSNPNNGLKIDNGFYRDFNDVLGYLRMPLFTFLSGYVYAYRPFQVGATSFLSKKARRLLVPMLIVGTAFALLQSLTPGTNFEGYNWLLLHIKPVAHFWFIEALFLIFILIVMLEKSNAFESLARWVLVLAVASVVYISPLSIDYFSINGFIYLCPYFVLGMGVNRFKLMKRLRKEAIFIMLLGVGLVLSFMYFDVLSADSKRTLLALILGMLGCTGLLGLKLELNFLAMIGAFSYSIYLYHVFFTSFARILINKMSVNPSLEVLVLLGIVAGILGPIVVHKIMANNNTNRVLFLGMGKQKNIQTKTQSLAT